MTDAYTPSNRRCIQFGVRKKNQRYSLRFWIFISKTLKRNVFIKRIPMDAFIVHLKIIALLLCGIKQTLIPQEGLPYSVALIGQTINAVVSKPNFCQFHNHSSSSSVIELPKYSGRILNFALPSALSTGRVSVRVRGRKRKISIRIFLVFLA